MSALSLWESLFLCELIFSKLETRANFLVSSYLYRWWQQALGLPSKLYWSWFMFSRFLFSREDSPHYSDLKLSTWTMRILVCLGTDFLWKFDGVYRRWNAFCVNRWHSNRYYTLNQGTEKRRDTKLKLSTRTMGILVSLGTDFLWKFDGVYRCWNAFCVNRWHSNRYYTINQGTEKRRHTKLKLSTRTMGILVSLGTDFLWKFDWVYRCWNAFCVNRWHSNRYYTINQGT